MTAIRHNQFCPNGKIQKWELYDSHLIYQLTLIRSDAATANGASVTDATNIAAINAN